MARDTEKSSYIDEAMEANQELSQYWVKLKHLTPEKLVKVANDSKRPVIEVIVAKSLLIACQDGLSLEKLLERICPLALNLNLRNHIISNVNHYEALDKE